MSEKTSKIANKTKKRKKYFTILSISREDFRNVGFDVSQATDLQMEYIAGKVGGSDALMAPFWEALRYWGEKFNFPKKKSQYEERSI